MRDWELFSLNSTREYLLESSKNLRHLTTRREYLRIERTIRSRIWERIFFMNASYYSNDWEVTFSLIDREVTFSLLNREVTFSLLDWEVTFSLNASYFSIDWEKAFSLNASYFSINREISFSLHASYFSIDWEVSFLNYEEMSFSNYEEMSFSNYEEMSFSNYEEMSFSTSLETMFWALFLACCLQTTSMIQKEERNNLLCHNCWMRSFTKRTRVESRHFWEILSRFI
jgi:hypothetical protein